jgi:hypothetical protein
MTVLYNLELTHAELLTLWTRYTFLHAGDKLDSDDIKLLEKFNGLLEGR